MDVSADTITVFGKKQSLLSAGKLSYKESRTPELSNYREGLEGPLHLKSEDEVSVVRFIT
jgi:hypothetical protein